LNTQTNYKRLLYAASLLVLLLSFGTIGFMLIEDFDLLNAFYMTTITISTVGFGEVHELSVGGKIFTTILILTSFGVLTYLVSIITTQFFEGQLSYILSGYQKKSIRKKMENHVIICGFGRNGQQAAKDLLAHNHKFIIIDQRKEIIMKNFGKQHTFIEGDATQEEVLLEAKIDKAKSLITTLPEDADNLFVALTARSMNPNIKIISRASSERNEKKLKIAGVDSVVMPERVGGAHMATLVARPDIIEFLEHLSFKGDNPTNIEEIACNDLPKEALNKTIFEIGVRQKTGANIIGFKTPEGEYILNPGANTKVIPNAKIFVLGTKQQIDSMKEVLHNSN